MNLFFRAHIVLKDDGGRYFIDQGLILTGFLVQTGIAHGLMSQHGGEALVVILDGDMRHLLAPTVDKLLDASQILAGLAVGLAGLANDDALYLLAGHILLQKVVEVMGGYSRQPASNEL